jgi:hypothetical protein
MPEAIGGIHMSTVAGSADTAHGAQPRVMPRAARAHSARAAGGGRPQDRHFAATPPDAIAPAPGFA